jgi:hypothetical protein
VKVGNYLKHLQTNDVAKILRIDNGFYTILPDAYECSSGYWEDELLRNWREMTFQETALYKAAKKHKFIKTNKEL